jgi:hypothetical protein
MRAPHVDLLRARRAQELRGLLFVDHEVHRALPPRTSRPL